MTTVRELFSGHRPIDRPIEKVIDYAAADDDRLAAEISEYEATDNIESAFTRFLDLYGDAIDRGQVTEIGVWLSGFYGSGKSSFSKYLGLALDHQRTVHGTPFHQLLSDRLTSKPLRAQFGTIGAKHKTAVVMLDLATDQLIESTATPVSTVLYRKVLEWAGYSREKKLADLEFTLERRGQLSAFEQAYRERFSGEWTEIHNQPLVGVARAAQIVPEFMPGEFPSDTAFRELRFDEALRVNDVAERSIELIKRRSGADAILILLDEAGQYVAPRADLILDLDGLARSLKEKGQGRTWIVATGQQTLAEIVKQAAYNSEELSKLKDRFPISLQLTAQDIREITYRRLLTKSPDGARQLGDLLGGSIGALVTHTRLADTKVYAGDPDLEGLVRFYPFLPQHFNLLLELVRHLARSTGGIGLRSAIRVTQDLLVDVSRSLPAGTIPIASRPAGTLACADDFYDALRNDIEKVLPHVISGVGKVAASFPGDPLTIRVAKSIAVLQVIEGFPRSRANIAALLYPRVGAPGLATQVDETITRLIGARECGVIDDPQTGGIGFVSDAIATLRDQRERYQPSGMEIAAQRTKVLQEVFRDGISASLHSTKTINAGIRFGRSGVITDGDEAGFRLEAADSTVVLERRAGLLVDTNGADWRTLVAWLFAASGEVDDLLAEVVRSEKIIKDKGGVEADRDVAQFVRSERNRQDSDRERAQRLLEGALLAGTFVFQGVATPVRERGASVVAAARAALADAAGHLFDKHSLAPFRASTDLAVRFLQADDLRRMPKDSDPLGLVRTIGGSARVDTDSPVLAEVLRVFEEKVRDSGAGRLQGNAIQDLFLAPPYGWTKDTTRYLFAALFRAGEVELYTPGGMLKTVGPQAREAFRSTLELGRVGIARRDTKPEPEALDRAAEALKKILGEDVLPLEDRIAEAVRTGMPAVTERVASLPERLRLLGLAGVERALQIHRDCTDLLAGDAGDAAARLGQRDSTLEPNIRWAEATVRALGEGAEDDVRRATQTLGDLDDIFLLDHPAGAALRIDTELAAVKDHLAAASLFEHVAALRTDLRKIDDAIEAAHAAAVKQLDQHLLSMRSRLESTPQWVRIDDDDRAEIIERLAAPREALAAAVGRRSTRYRTLLGLLARLSKLEEDLATEIRTRAVDDATESQRVAHVRPTDLIPYAVLRPESVDPWLAGIRERTNDYFASADEIRVEDHEA